MGFAVAAQDNKDTHKGCPSLERTEITDRNSHMIADLHTPIVTARSHTGNKLALAHKPVLYEKRKLFKLDKNEAILKSKFDFIQNNNKQTNNNKVFRV